MVIEYIETGIISESKRREIAVSLKFTKNCSCCESVITSPKGISPCRGNTKIAVYWFSSGDDVVCSKKCCTIMNNRKISNKYPESYKNRGVKSGNTQRGRSFEDIHGHDSAIERKNNLSIKMTENNPRWSLKYRTPEEIEKQKELNRNGNSPFSILNARKTYEERYGKERAYEIKQKLSALRIGEKNPMFGKSPSIYSGAGTKGYYNGIFFRSLIECSFIHKCFQEGIKIETAETKKYWVDYIVNGKHMTYKPDFIINDKTIVEIKHSRFINSEENTAKFSAAKNAFDDYIVLTQLDIPYIPRYEFKELLVSECIKLL